MLYLREQLSGVDVPIQRLQKLIYDWFLKDRKIDEKQYDCYGRVYMNQKKGGYVPEFYKGNGDYTDTFFNDKVDALSFFTVGDNVEYDVGQPVAEIGLIFCLNLQKLYDIKDRADEKAHNDIVNYVKSRFGGTLLSVDYTIDRVFREFERDSIKFRDMHPWHCFRLNFKLMYDITC